MVKLHLRISPDAAILRRNMSPPRHRPSPTAPMRMLWRDETQNRENNPMQSRFAREKARLSDQPDRITLRLLVAPTNLLPRQSRHKVTHP